MCDFVSVYCQLGSYWISASRNETDDSSPFLWHLPGGDTMPVNLTNGLWYPGTPDNNGYVNEACVFVGPGDGSYQMNDAQCWYPFCGICEIDVN